MKRNRPTFRAATAFGLLFVLFAVATTSAAAQETAPTFVERIQKTAETLEIFPVDLIARDGPLSYFKENSPYPKISFRNELTPESFERFYNFCQLALDATPQDVDALVDYLPQASPREAALILTVFYVYVFPWENPPLATGYEYFADEKRVEREVAIRTQSWLALQYPRGAFDLATRERFRPQNVDSQRLLPIIARYAQREENVFPAIRAVAERAPENYDEESREFLASVSFDILSRKAVLDETRRKYPDSAAKKISLLSYKTYGFDTLDPGSSIGPRSGNASETPKTLGQIARQLLASWERTTTTLAYVERVRETAAATEVFPVDLLARDGEIPFFEPDSNRPKTACQTDLTPESFERFYDFCQLALDATPQEIDALVAYLRFARPEETALILTIFYVYAQPWENDERIETQREKRRAGGLKGLKEIVARYRLDKRVAFPARQIDADAPVQGNASEKPKTVGEIARRLLDSWEPKPQTQTPGLLAFDAATRKKALGALGAILFLATFAVAARIVAAKKRKAARRLD